LKPPGSSLALRAFLLREAHPLKQGLKQHWLGEISESHGALERRIH